MAQTLVRVLVHLIFSTKDRANVIRPEVESELIQFLTQTWGGNTASATSGGEGVCDPFRVVMWFVGGGRFPGALPPATLPAPFQGAWGEATGFPPTAKPCGNRGTKVPPSEARNRVLPQPARVLSIGGRPHSGLRVSKVLDNWGTTFRSNAPLPPIAVHLAPVNLPPVRYFPPISGAPWTLATRVLEADVFALGGMYESENRDE